MPQRKQDAASKAAAHGTNAAAKAAATAAAKAVKEDAEDAALSAPVTAGGYPYAKSFGVGSKRSRTQAGVA